jgi:hypothetical protein
LHSVLTSQLAHLFDAAWLLGSSFWIWRGSAFLPRRRYVRVARGRIVGRRSRVVVVLIHFSFPCVIVPARTHARPLTLDVEDGVCAWRALFCNHAAGLLRRPSSFVASRGSALPPKADMCGATRDVRFGPIADIRQGLTTPPRASRIGARAAEHLAPQSISSPTGSCAKTAAWHDMLLVEVKKPDESFWNKPFFKEQGKPERVYANYLLLKGKKVDFGWRH